MMQHYFTNYKELRTCLYLDTYRYLGELGGWTCYRWFKFYIRHPEYRYVLWMRVYQYSIGRNVLVLLRMICMVILKILRNKTGIQISPYTKIGKGLYIGHFGSIVINPAVIIGDCCNIIQTCTIGLAYRGKNEGVPQIGDRVYIGPGARIIGGIHICNDVAIGANAVVTHDAIDNSVIAGVPAKLISLAGSEGYIYNHIDKNGILHPRYEWKMKLAD